MTPATGTPRLLRAGAFAAAAVSLALAAHTAAGGERPGGLALAVALVAVTCPAVLLAGRRRGRLVVGGALLLAQAGLHTWFSLNAGSACSVTGGSAGHHAASPCAPPAGPAAATSGAAPMLLAHVAAVVLTALLLAHGESLLWRLAELGLLRLPAPGRAAPAVAAQPQPPAPSAPRPRPILLVAGTGRRGPPAAATV